MFFEKIIKLASRGENSFLFFTIVSIIVEPNIQQKFVRIGSVHQFVPLRLVQTCVNGMHLHSKIENFLTG